MIHAHNCGDAVFLLLANHWGLFRLSNVQHGFPNAEGAWNLPPGSETFLFRHVSVSKLARPAISLKSFSSRKGPGSWADQRGRLTSATTLGQHVVGRGGLPAR